MQKREVYFNEYNVLMEDAVYLPLVSGLLQAYAQTMPRIQENYEFMPFLFIRDDVDKIIAQYKNPSVAAFSVSMWNSNLSMEVARKIKEKFPHCLTIFGGPQIPHEAAEFFEKYPFVDISVRGDGEQTFANILTRFLESRDFNGIPGISYRHQSGQCVRNSIEHIPAKDLDIYPSPYTTGLFAEIMSKNKNIDFQAIVETNRGCPFLCTFCFWGQGGLNKRFRFFSEGRIAQIAEWLGKNKIKYVFCADSNFGMFNRDLEIARYFVDAKIKYGFPEKFRVCYGKNAENSIYETAKLLAEHGLAKTITLARQSNNPQTLENIKRRNIKMEVYNNLQARYHADEMSTYTELILGLPGETYESFVEGLEEILNSIIDNQVFIYHCQVLPNTDFSKKDYLEKHGIVTRSVPLNEVHASVRPRDLTTEYEDIVVATNTLSLEEWKKATVLSWTTQLFYGLKAGFYIINYLVDRYQIGRVKFLEYISELKHATHLKNVHGEIKNFHDATQALLEGNSRCRVLPDFGFIYWEPEEAAFLNISNDKEHFFIDLLKLVEEYLISIGKNYDVAELKEVVEYQKARFPDYRSIKKNQYNFHYNLPEYFGTYFHKNREPLLKIPQNMVLIGAIDYRGDKKIFAREILLYGRKNNKTFYDVTWMSEKMAREESAKS